MWCGLVLLVSCLLSKQLSAEAARDFPEGFLFGAASSAYQVEGGWNASDKGPNVWDAYSHNYPDAISDRSNGDVSADSYHLYRKDIEALKNIGANTYRFSLSWSRLLPTGFINQTSKDGARYYSNLINHLLSNGIEPMVTLYHWDTPEPLQRIGGFTSAAVVPLFEDYADYAFQQFGDRVKYWVTFNEMNINCVAGYGGRSFAPSLGLPGRAEYLCAHNMILAHAAAYRLYRRKYAALQGGKVGIAHQMFGYYPYSSKKEDIDAANILEEFTTGWILHPIYSETGDYPAKMKRFVKKKSLAEKERRSRLPEFTPAEVISVRNSADFLGINHYSSYICTFAPIQDTDVATPVDMTMVFPSDVPVYTYILNKWKRGDYPIYPIVPDGFSNGLIRVSRSYRHPHIIITENGFPYKSTSTDLNDYTRVDYLNEYLHAVNKARNKGVDIGGYLHWSLMDNFEWNSGYEMQFGLYAINFSSPNRERIGRLSSRVYANIIKTGTIDYTYLPIIHANNDATVI